MTRWSLAWSMVLITEAPKLPDARQRLLGERLLCGYPAQHHFARALGFHDLERARKRLVEIGPEPALLRGRVEIRRHAADSLLCAAPR